MQLIYAGMPCGMSLSKVKDYFDLYVDTYIHAGNLFGLGERGRKT